MKGFTGLAIAAILGLAGAICNWLYLERASNTQDKVAFIGIRNDVTLNVGDAIQEEHLQQISLPKGAVGNLDKVAPQWSARPAIIGQRANRVFQGGEIILEIDLAAPAQQQLARTLQPDEVAFWVPLDPRSVVTEQINPGDLVSFEIPPAAESKTPSGLSKDDKAAADEGEILGPFRVLAIGSRREPTNVQQAFRGRMGNEATLTIVAELKQGQLDPLTARLSRVLGTRARQGLVVLLHSAKHPAP